MEEAVSGAGPWKMMGFLASGRGGVQWGISILQGIFSAI